MSCYMKDLGKPLKPGRVTLKVETSPVFGARHLSSPSNNMVPRRQVPLVSGTVTEVARRMHAWDWRIRPLGQCRYSSFPGPHYCQGMEMRQGAATLTGSQSLPGPSLQLMDGNLAGAAVQILEMCDDVGSVGLAQHQARTEEDAGRQSCLARFCEMCVLGNRCISELSKNK